AERDLAHVRGRCVDERGAPLAGCRVRFHGSGGTPAPAQSAVAWRDPIPVTTGDDRRFDFAFALLPSMSFELEAQADARAPRTGHWFSIPRQQRNIDLGDIALAPGFAVRGQVVDELGAPAAKMWVGLRNLPEPAAAYMQGFPR